MSQLYRAIDKMDGKDSAFLIASDGVVITTWEGDENWEIECAKERELEPSTSDFNSFGQRAINPVLIAKW